MSSWHIASACFEYGLKRLLNTLLAVKCGSGCKCWIINYSFDSSQIDLGQFKPLLTRPFHIRVVPQVFRE